MSRLCLRAGAELAALTNEAAIRSVRRAVASIASEQGGGGGGGAGMAMPAHSGAGGPVTMADFDSALVDFVTSRRKGPVGGLLGKACQTALPLPPRAAALTPPRPPRAREGPRLVLLARRLPPLLLPPPRQYGGATLLRACVRSGWGRESS